VVRPDGSRLFVTGFSDGGATGYDYATVAYDPTTGEQLWAARYNGPGNGSDWPNSIAVSPDGTRVFVGGDSQPDPNNVDNTTLAYNSATGSKLWEARFPSDYLNSPTPVAVSPDGSTVLVAGTSNGTYGTAAYHAATGSRKWFTKSPTAGFASQLALNPNGSKLFLTGTDTTGLGDYMTIAYATR
jgi:outer membrane protein assembly factor BamB